MLKITENEIRGLQVGETLGPFIATRKEIHRVQANLSNFKAKYPGALFENKSKPYYRNLPNGKKERMNGFYEYYVTRIARGISADTGIEE